MTQVEPSTQRSQGTQSDGAGREAVYAGYPRAYKLINEAYSQTTRVTEKGVIVILPAKS